MRRSFTSKLTGVIAALSFAAVAGTALAANVGTDVSSAGQGDAAVEGFTVTDIEYDATPTSAEEQVIVTEVRFEITRDDDGTVQGPTQPSDADAEAFVQLRDGDTRSDWATCTLDNGAATCPVTGDERIEIEALTGHSIVAYDTFAAGGRCPMGRVDINAADAEVLEEIIHIGPVRAQMLEELRPFASVEDLARIDGLGPARLADILEQGVACVS